MITTLRQDQLIAVVAAVLLSRQDVPVMPGDIPVVIRWAQELIGQSKQAWDREEAEAREKSDYEMAHLINDEGTIAIPTVVKKKGR